MESTTAVLQKQLNNLQKELVNMKQQQQLQQQERQRQVILTPKQPQAPPVRSTPRPPSVPPQRFQQQEETEKKRPRYLSQLQSRVQQQASPSSATSAMARGKPGTPPKSRPSPPGAMARARQWRCASSPKAAACSARNA